MENVFDPNNPSIEKVVTPLFNRYSRSDRRKAAFVLLDKNGEYGRWNAAEKEVEFAPQLFLQHVTSYKFLSIVALWEKAGMHDTHQIKCIRKNAEKVLYLS